MSSHFNLQKEKIIRIIEVIFWCSSIAKGRGQEGETAPPSLQKIKGKSVQWKNEKRKEKREKEGKEGEGKGKKGEENGK